MQFSQSFLDIASVVLAVLVIILMVFWGRRQARMRLKILENMGFKRWDEIDERMIEEFRSLVVHTHPERLVIQEAFWKALPNMRLVLFDLAEKQRGGSTNRGRMLAVYKPGMDLPEFRLFPQNDEYGEGRQAEIIKKDVERLMDFALQKFGEKPIDFSDQPEIARRFLISGRDEERVRQFLSPERLNRLLSLPQGTVLQAGSELILIGRLSTIPRKKQTWEESLQESIDLATTVAKIL